MESTRQDEPPAYTDDDWEDVQPSQPDDTISIVSENEGLADRDNQDFVEVEDPKKTKYPGRIYRNPNDEPIGPLPTLRKVLYDLKDILKDSVAHLEDFNQEASMSALSLSGPIMQAQQRQIDTLIVLLTNYASDWETHSAQGGMTFDEFADLDPTAVHELCRIFRGFAWEVKQRAKHTSNPEVEDDDEDVGWLDFILPAIDEVSMLLRVPEADTKDTLGQFEHSKPTVHTPRDAKSDQAEAHRATNNEPTNQKKNDEKVHEKMMMVSDW